MTRMSNKQMKKLVKEGRIKITEQPVYQKYHARKAEKYGEKFDSVSEMMCFDWIKYLLLATRCCKISRLYHADIMKMGVTDIGMLPDFKVECEKGIHPLEYHEYKGYETKEWMLKKKLWRAFGPAHLHVWMGRGNDLHKDEIIIPNVTITPTTE